MSYNYLIQTVSECAAAFADQQDNPDHWQPICRELGNLLQGMGRFEEAITWHSLSLESQPNLAEIYAQLGRLSAQEKNWDVAIAFFEKALESIPDSVHIYSNLAQIYGQTGKRELETDCWYKAVELNPDLVNAQGYYKLGQAFEEQGKVEEAIECYQKAGDREAALLPAHYKIAEIKLRQRDLEGAKACFEHIIQQDFKQPQAHYQLGTILSHQRKFESATIEFNHTIKLAPDFARAYSSLVQALIRQKKWDEAISTCHSILNLVEEFPWIYSLLGNALQAKGKINEAVAAYQKACAGRGWQECLTNNYFIPVDHFTNRLAIFETHLLPFANQENFAALEVGNDLGMSACWLLDKILTSPSARLTCVDNPFNSKLEENLIKTGSIDKVTLRGDNIPQHLALLKPLSFDFANLQYRKRQWDYVKENTELAWKAVKVGGIVFVAGYGWQIPNNPEQNVKKGVDIFLESIKGQWEAVAHHPQAFMLIVRKTAQSKDKE
ncbi:TPR repeat-containing protein [Xenococcus sp. PCC 7305]|uniref:tetratricopeptide repeat protein n=1 Tax=Xenococcus sp. PCC 7305 TaxID=102125 RepID=UPI0002AC5DB4|nr:tetratricopeptide repeat protein [Xenococcus sp. PCC 7305]ELS04416.1 TPR repeat-containing protein [Xenococcus sp. PCC 7305]